MGVVACFLRVYSLISMFIGEYLHTLDPKNRISLPAKFRKDLGRAVVITRGLDHCLFVYPKKAWAKEAESRAVHAGGTAAARGLARLFLAGAMEAEVDTAGRAVLSALAEQGVRVERLSGPALTKALPFNLGKEAA